MRKRLICILLLGSITVSAQIPVYPIYFDAVTLGATTIESKSSQALTKAREETTKELRKTLIATTAEELGRTKLRDVKRRIYFKEYSGLCDTYLNGRKRKLCEAKMEYLEEAHDIVYEFLESGTENKIRKGVQDQIWEKYASICILLYKELEALKRATDKNDKLKYFTKLITN